MRPRVIAGMLLALVVFTAGVVWLSKTLQSRSTTSSAGSKDGQTARAGAARPGGDSAKPDPGSTPSPSVPALIPATNVPPDPAHERAVRQKLAELKTLAMRNDTASRDAILAELQNPDQDVRRAALEASIQFGDRSVVPRLQEVAAQTEDADEKAEILAAIEYINLPSLTEYIAERQSRMAAAGLTNSTRFRTNRLGRPVHTGQPTLE